MGKCYLFFFLKWLIEELNDLFRQMGLEEKIPVQKCEPGFFLIVLMLL